MRTGTSSTHIEETHRPEVHLARPGGASTSHAQFREEIGARLRWIGPGRILLTLAAAGAVGVGGVLLMRVPDPTQIGREAVAEARAEQYAPVTTPEFELLPLSGVNEEAEVGSSQSDPTTAMEPSARETVIVHVAGAVREPGVFVLDASARVVDAVRLAGGPKLEADLDAVNLAAPVVDGQRVRIPTAQEVSAGWAADPIPSGVPSTPAPAAPSHGGPAIVNLNTASAQELATLPGVGPVTAAAIIADRAARGPFRRVDDLARVRGIGSAKVAALRPMARVG